MASKFSAFMAQNVEKIENKKVIVSERFKENGKPVEWEIRAITEDENQALQRKAYVNVPVTGQRGAYTREMDQVKYTSMMLAASVVFPDLNDAELQDSYGVKTPDELLKKMLIPSEMGILAEAVTSFIKRGEADLIAEAKN